MGIAEMVLLPLLLAWALVIVMLPNWISSFTDQAKHSATVALLIKNAEGWNMAEYIAHVKKDELGQFSTHDLHEHLQQVGVLAGTFAQHFDSGNWAYIAGLWHDLGKYRPAFQQYIKRSSGYDPEAHITSEAKAKTAHASTGALYAMEKMGVLGRLLAYVIAGHHAGLPDFEVDDAKGRALRETLNADKDFLAEALAQPIPDEILQTACPKTLTEVKSPKDLHLWLRMLFSCLVDADFLDTERFMAPGKSANRVQGATPTALLRCFNQHMDKLQAGAQATEVNTIRAEILAICRANAAGATGIYTMTVPTGGGKTLSSLAFALEHAVHHSKRRVIYAIPYTSIIEQTASVFREIFAPLGDVLIEHHSNIEPAKPEDEKSWSRLATENWDAPLIVTTTVQLFESLYAARTSRCRKLHNLVNSVIVLDETQLLPVEQLAPIRHVIQLLSQDYRVTFVMSTATPTGFKEHSSPFGKQLLQEMPSQEIIAAPEQYYQQLTRVHYTLPEDFNQGQSWDEIAEALQQHESVLAVVNTRNDAKTLWEKMPAGAYHLSALMCPAHRSEKIAEIKTRLASVQNQPIRVISTQLVEAGVDLDFPAVYRALAGLDSIVQAAGRCNREGRLAQGQVVVFVPPTKTPQGILTTATDTTKSVLTGFSGDIQSPATFQDYFKRFFDAVTEHDKHRVLAKLQATADELQIQFRTAAQRFKLIDDKDTVSVFVRYREGDSLINKLQHEPPQRWLLRKLQRYSVTLYHYEFDAMRQRGEIEEVRPGFYAQSESGFYSDDLGLITEFGEIKPKELII